MTWEDLWYGPPTAPAHLAARVALAPAAAAFALGSALHHWSWDVGLRRPHRVAGLQIWSVGNVVVGGAGKTPVVIFLARWALAAGKRVAILSRGYGREGKGLVHFDATCLPPVAGVGDEPRLLARSVPGATVWVGADRVASAEQARAAGATVAILDDGFQHRRLFRDVDLAVVGAMPAPWPLPAGPLREPVSALRRADVAWVRDDTALAHPCVVRARHEATAVRTPAGALVPLQTLSGHPVVALCGIARPRPFFAALEAAGAQVVARLAYPDHHPFTPVEIAQALAAARTAGARLVTTEKDLERLPDGIEAWAPVLDVELLDGAAALADRLGLPLALVPRPGR